jgi:hypothetical protein
MTTLRFVLDGPAAHAAQAEFKKALESLQPGLDIEVEPATALPEVARKVIDPISVAALVLSIPGAVLAVIDIADRISKRRRAQKLIDEAKRLREQTGVQVFVVQQDIPKSLDSLTADSLLELAGGAGGR